jgi:hypothetical protein
MMAAYGGSDAAVRYLIVQHGVGLDSVSVQCCMAHMVGAGGLCGPHAAAVIGVQRSRPSMLLCCCCRRVLRRAASTATATA